MKRISLSLATILLLAACSTEQTARYRLTFDVTDVSDQQALTTASMDVIDRRLAHLGVQMTGKDTQVQNNETVLVVRLPNQEAADALTAELVQPFDLSIMSETGPNETVDLTIEGRGNFTKTDITQEDFTWVAARKDPKNGRGEVRLQLTEEGRTKIQALFKKMQGKSIGIFVRGRLVSLLTVQSDEVPNDLIIRDVPNADIATIFADDMNVGLHVTFTPVP
ncbi:hypothetical protein K8942_05145 [Candidatus Peribacteria bacterium]|nr:MAG: hypothetical protein K8942_05145 [Candidatus Peribacteria bacterium]